MKYDLIIVGAGASGLWIAKELSKAGYHCCLLEAQNRAGGRIHTIYDAKFDMHLETGAEFIHGKLPLTHQLVRDANAGVSAVGGKMISIEKGEWSREEKMDDDWNLFMRKLNQLESDLTLGQFLDENFPSESFAGLRSAVRGFAEGFDLADISIASALALCEEWKHENERQHRVEGGYAKLVDFLLASCQHQKCAIHFSTPVNKIAYNANDVKVFTKDGREFQSAKIVITVSAGVLQAGVIELQPAPAAYIKAIHELGFGTVIKYFFQFGHPLWKDVDPQTGFLLSDQVVPTWWTQAPSDSNLFTGWLGGPGAAAKATLPDSELINLGISSLSELFHLDAEGLRRELLGRKVCNWAIEPFVRGGYSYSTVYSSQARRILSHPIQQTVFFAGEAIAEGESPGTVEAAFESAVAAVKKIKASAIH